MKSTEETVKPTEVRGTIGSMTEHKPVPELIELHHRWQCKVCHTWINYSEANGKWWHETFADRMASRSLDALATKDWGTM